MPIIFSTVTLDAQWTVRSHFHTTIELLGIDPGQSLQIPVIRTNRSNVTCVSIDSLKHCLKPILQSTTGRTQCTRVKSATHTPQLCICICTSFFFFFFFTLKILNLYFCSSKDARTRLLLSHRTECWCH